MAERVGGGFDRKTWSFYPGPDLTKVMGRRFSGPGGRVWELASHNDLNVPYFARVVRGRVQKTLYTVPFLDYEVSKALRES